MPLTFEVSNPSEMQQHQSSQPLGTVRTNETKFDKCTNNLWQSIFDLFVVGTQLLKSTLSPPSSTTAIATASTNTIAASSSSVPFPAVSSALTSTSQVQLVSSGPKTTPTERPLHEVVVSDFGHYVERFELACDELYSLVEFSRQLYVLKLNWHEAQMRQSPVATEMEKVKETMHTIHSKLQSS
jgi:hypothetical protein